MIGVMSNKAGIGACVRIITNGLSQIRQVTGGTGRIQNSLPVEFGLGSYSVVDTLVVHWPSGMVDVVPNVSANQIVTVLEGEGVITGVHYGESAPITPQKYELEQNYPNPFNPQTLFNYQVPKGGKVTITIYNVLGQKISTLIDEVKPPGRYRIEWSGKDDRGEVVPSGLYIYRLEANGFSDSRKMLLIR